jgi:hypothetical protein
MANYYDLVLAIKANTPPEDETKRIACLQFLYPARYAAYLIANAAEAESSGDFLNARENTLSS